MNSYYCHQSSLNFTLPVHFIPPPPHLFFSMAATLYLHLLGIYGTILCQQWPPVPLKGTNCSNTHTHTNNDKSAHRSNL